ncbi:MAG: NAD-dependent epimerase/dehydratase family protein [Acidobacteriaceae bacterium]|nr:NAD-dependent epimerase/dehydratase family protein [Acidobacteriaceae bacterium]
MPVRGTFDVCKHSSGIDRFVYVSTVAVLGSAVGRVPASESAECHPIDAYGESKLLSERIVLEATRSGLPAVIARPMWIYGSESVVTGNLFRRIAKRRFPLLGRGDNLMQPVALRDAVSGILKCATVADIEGRVYNIAGPEVLTIRNMCATIAAATNVRYPVLYLPMAAATLLTFSCEWMLPVLGFNPPMTRRSLLFFQVNHTYSIDRARRELNWHPAITFREGATEIAAGLGLAAPIQP